MHGKTDIVVLAAESNVKTDFLTIEILSTFIECSEGHL